MCVDLFIQPFCHRQVFVQPRSELMMLFIQMLVYKNKALFDILTMKSE